MPDYMDLVSTSIAFIDTALDDRQTLHNGIEAGTEVITLDGVRDGVEQITVALASRSGINSIHIISHGSPGSLQLGATKLSLTNLRTYAKQLQQWSAALAESPEILLYGCDVAAGEKGANFVQQLSQLTRANIAASRSPVGSAALGGDWELDYTTGAVSSGLAIEPATRAAYQFVFGLQLLGQAGFPASTTFGGTLVGGLSGLTYAGSNTYYAISDGRNIPGASPGPSRFYTLTIPTVSSGSLTPVPGQVNFTAVTQIGNPPPFATDTSDTEGIGFIGGNVFVSSEGNFSTNTQPFINSFAITTGVQNLALTIPASKYDVSADTNSGIRNNQAFESLTITPSQSFLFTATENALEQDGPASGTTAGARSRILRYNLGPNTANGEFLYNTDPRNGISEMLAVDDNTLLVLERFLDLSTTPPSGDLKLYQISLNGATDIQTNTGLIASGVTGITPVSKTLIADFPNTSGFPINNFEGMTFGPSQTATGKRSLILVSDNNFALPTAFAAFAANHAPVLDNSGTPTPTAINEDVPSASNTGTLVSALIAGAVTDPDTSDTQGIAVTATDNTNGSWEYSTDSGATWTAFGTPSTAAARLLAGNASIRFVPNADYNGSADITYQAWDGTTTNSGTTTTFTNGGTGDISTASSIGGLAAFSTASETATITVNSVNDAPSFVKGVDRTLNRNAGPQTVAGWATAISPGPANESAQTVSFQVVGNDNTGLFSVPPAIDSLGQLTFTPAGGATGTANITLNLKDNGGIANSGVDTSANQAFVVNITNNPPIANPDTYTVPHDKVLFSGPSVLINDTDADFFDVLVPALVKGPSNGTIVFNPLGDFIYTPKAGFIGTDTFTYSVSDGVGTVPGTVNINVTNNPPIAQADNYSINGGTVLSVTVPGVLANDSDADLDTLSAAVAANPTKGSIALNKNGSFTYSPNAGFSGTDTFTYTVSDGIASSAPATVTVSVKNNPPVANSDSYTTAFNTSLNVTGLGVLINDTDPENDSLTAVLVTGPTKGAIDLKSDGTFSYTPSAGFAGTDSFTYKANDGKADSAIATASIIVNNPPTSPTPTSPTPTSPTPTTPTPTTPTPTSPTSPTPTSPTPTTPTPTTPTPTTPTPTTPTPTTPTPTTP
ncbi:MAG: esterase-like activity of phytase family protein, partial [Microcoleus sp.]